jgi:hypothetical protein
MNFRLPSPPWERGWGEDQEHGYKASLRSPKANLGISPVSGSNPSPLYNGILSMAVGLS